jgi:acyl carrier protein
LREAIEKWLIGWFVNRGKLERGILEKQPDALRNADYFDAGWLTSLEVVEFVTEIEQEFDMQFSDRDLQDQRFVSITGLAELILELSPLTNNSR